jgi:hypothetical protein
MHTNCWRARHRLESSCSCPELRGAPRRAGTVLGRAAEPLIINVCQDCINAMGDRSDEPHGIVGVARNLDFVPVLRAVMRSCLQKGRPALGDDDDQVVW